MNVLSISPSILEEFRNLTSGNYELWGKGVEDFRQYILGPRQASQAMSKGIAYGAMLEHGPEQYRSDTVNPGGYKVYEPQADTNWHFTKEAGQPARAFRADHPNGVYEVGAKLEFEVLGLPVIMRMRIDCVDGLALHEFKTSARAKKLSDRQDSLQWRCYLAAFPGASSLTYHEFQLPDNGSYCKVNTFTFRPYGGITEDVKRSLSELVRWLENEPAIIEARTIAAK